VLTLKALTVHKADVILQNIFASVKASLERLGLEYIDVLQCHRFDPKTPIEETVCLPFPSETGASILLASTYYRCKPYTMLSKPDM
jgi:hypothetical protein